MTHNYKANWGFVSQKFENVRKPGNASCFLLETNIFFENSKTCFRPIRVFPPVSINYFQISYPWSNNFLLISVGYPKLEQIDPKQASHGLKIVSATINISINVTKKNEIKIKVQYPLPMQVLCKDTIFTYHRISRPSLCIFMRPAIPVKCGYEFFCRTKSFYVIEKTRDGRPAYEIVSKIHCKDTLCQKMDKPVSLSSEKTYNRQTWPVKLSNLPRKQGTRSSVLWKIKKDKRYTAKTGF